jgi:hypothetical protein
MGAVIVAGVNWILVIIGIIGVIGFMLLLPGAIIGAVFISKEKDEIKRKSLIKKAIIFGVMPFILVIGSLIGIVILKALQALFSK